MKIFFGINITDNPDNEAMDGDVFVTQKLPSLQAQALENATEQYIDNISAKISSWKIIGSALPFLIAAIAFAIFVNLSEDVSFLERAQQYWYLLAIVIFMLFLGIFLSCRSKETALTEEEEAQKEHLDTLQDQASAYFNVPPDATEMDLLSINYRVKNGKIQFVENGFSTFSNFVAMAYRENDSLCLTTDEEKHTIPLSQITGIRTINKRASLMVWYKDTPYNKGEYKSYKMTASQWGGDISFKPYYSLCIQRDGEEYELYFPPYELPLIQRLTGIETVQ